MTTLSMYDECTSNIPRKNNQFARHSKFYLSQIAKGKNLRIFMGPIFSGFWLVISRLISLLSFQI